VSGSNDNICSPTRKLASPWLVPLVKKKKNKGKKKPNRVVVGYLAFGLFQKISYVAKKKKKVSHFSFFPHNDYLQIRTTLIHFEP